MREQPPDLATELEVTKEPATEQEVAKEPTKATKATKAIFNI